MDNLNEKKQIKGIEYSLEACKRNLVLFDYVTILFVMEICVQKLFETKNLRLDV